MTEREQKLLAAARAILRCDFLADFTPVLAEDTPNKIGAKRVSEALGQLKGAVDEYE